MRFVHVVAQSKILPAIAGAMVILASPVRHAIAQEPGISQLSNLGDIDREDTRHQTELQPQNGTVTAAPENFYKVQVGPGFLLRVNVFDIPELTNLDIRVDTNGNISVPGIGTVHLAGLTVPQIEDLLTNDWVNKRYLVNPIVRVNIIEFTTSYIAVLGEVTSPGRYPAAAARDLGDVLAQAGGESIGAGGRIEVRHTDADRQIETKSYRFHPQQSISTLSKIMVQPGDTVFVPRASAIYVLGAVNRSGGYLMVDGGNLSIYEALSLAGGMTVDASHNGMRIIRPLAEGGYEELPVPFSKLSGPKAKLSQLQPNDVLYIPRNGFKVALLDGSSIIGAAVSGSLYAVR